ncbi:hypothetical protein D3C84_1220260 [compost metagenome]
MAEIIKPNSVFVMEILGLLDQLDLVELDLPDILEKEVLQVLQDQVCLARLVLPEHQVHLVRPDLLD